MYVCVTDRVRIPPILSVPNEDYSQPILERNALGGVCQKYSTLVGFSAHSEGLKFMSPQSRVITVGYDVIPSQQEQETEPFPTAVIPYTINDEEADGMSICFHYPLLAQKLPAYRATFLSAFSTPITAEATRGFVLDRLLDFGYFSKLTMGSYTLSIYKNDGLVCSEPLPLSHTPLYLTPSISYNRDHRLESPHNIGNSRYQLLSQRLKNPLTGAFNVLSDSDLIDIVNKLAHKDYMSYEKFYLRQASRGYVAPSRWKEAHYTHSYQRDAHHTPIHHEDSSQHALNQTYQTPPIDASEAVHTHPPKGFLDTFFEGLSPRHQYQILISLMKEPENSVISHLILEELVVSGSDLFNLIYNNRFELNTSPDASIYTELLKRIPIRPEEVLEFFDATPLHWLEDFIEAYNAEGKMLSEERQFGGRLYDGSSRTIVSMYTNSTLLHKNLPEPPSRFMKHTHLLHTPQWRSIVFSDIFALIKEVISNENFSYINANFENYVEAVDTAFPEYLYSTLSNRTFFWIISLAARGAAYKKSSFSTLRNFYPPPLLNPQNRTHLYHPIFQEQYAYDAFWLNATEEERRAIVDFADRADFRKLGKPMYNEYAFRAYSLETFTMLFVSPELFEDEGFDEIMTEFFTLAMPEVFLERKFLVAEFFCPFSPEFLVTQATEKGWETVSSAEFDSETIAGFEAYQERKKRLEAQIQGSGGGGLGAGGGGGGGSANQRGIQEIKSLLGGGSSTTTTTTTTTIPFFPADLLAAYNITSISTNSLHSIESSLKPVTPCFTEEEKISLFTRSSPDIRHRLCNYQENSSKISRGTPTVSIDTCKNSVVGDETFHEVIEALLKSTFFHPYTNYFKFIDCETSSCYDNQAKFYAKILLDALPAERINRLLKRVYAEYKLDIEMIAKILPKSLSCLSLFETVGAYMAYKGNGSLSSITQFDPDRDVLLIRAAHRLFGANPFHGLNPFGRDFPADRDEHRVTTGTALEAFIEFVLKRRSNTTSFAAFYEYLISLYGVPKLVDRKDYSHVFSLLRPSLKWKLLQPYVHTEEILKALSTYLKSKTSPYETLLSMSFLDVFSESQWEKLTSTGGSNEVLEGSVWYPEIRKHLLFSGSPFVNRRSGSYQEACIPFMGDPQEASIRLNYIKADAVGGSPSLKEAALSSGSDVIDVEKLMKSSEQPLCQEVKFSVGLSEIPMILISLEYEDKLIEDSTENNITVYVRNITKLGFQACFILSGPFSSKIARISGNPKYVYSAFSRIGQHGNSSSSSLVPFSSESVAFLNLRITSLELGSAYTPTISAWKEAMYSFLHALAARRQNQVELYGVYPGPESVQASFRLISKGENLMEEVLAFHDEFVKTTDCSSPELPKKTPLTPGPTPERSTCGVAERKEIQLFKNSLREAEDLKPLKFFKHPSVWLSHNKFNYHFPLSDDVLFDYLKAAEKDSPLAQLAILSPCPNDYFRMESCLNLENPQTGYTVDCLVPIKNSTCTVQEKDVDFQFKYYS